MIRATDRGGFAISAYQVGIPGWYACERAAKYAFRFSPDDIHNMWVEFRNDQGGIAQRPITFEEMQAWRRKKDAPDEA